MNVISTREPHFDYQAYYCEENVWQLCRHPLLVDRRRFAVFISNPEKTVAMWHMRAGTDPGEAVVWDYHVVLVTAGEKVLLWDLDSLLGCPVAPDLYLNGSFSTRIKKRYQPMFRVVPAPVFLDTFRSDRSHMLGQEGDWHAPPPPWPPIGTGEENNLQAFIDMTADFHGDVFDLAAFGAWLANP